MCFIGVSFSHHIQHRFFVLIQAVVREMKFEHRTSNAAINVFNHLNYKCIEFYRKKNGSVVGSDYNNKVFGCLKENKENNWSSLRKSQTQKRVRELRREDAACCL